MQYNFNTGRGIKLSSPPILHLSYFSLFVSLFHWLCLRGAFSGPCVAVLQIDVWPFGSCRQRPTLIMSDSRGRLRKIIITKQWSELPHSHFHTTSDLSANLPGHDQGQGSERAPLISQLTNPGFFLLSFFYFPHHLCVCLSVCLSASLPACLSFFLSVCPVHSSSPVGPNWVISSPGSCEKRKQEKSIGKIGESLWKSKCFPQTRSPINGYS